MKSLNFGAEKIAVVSLKNNFINLGSDAQMLKMFVAGEYPYEPEVCILSQRSVKFLVSLSQRWVVPCRPAL